MELFLLRHGETSGNLLKRYNGRTDEPLCEQGRVRAQNLAQKVFLPLVEQVYVSPLARARQTAALIFPQVRQIVVDDLQEMDFGIFEGRSAADMAQDEEYRAWVEAQCEPACPQGESWPEFDLRTQNAFVRLVAEGLANQEECLVIVAHGGTCASIMGRWAYPRRAYYEWFVPNCGGYCVVLREDQWKRDGLFAEWTPFFSPD
jgi:alpha-ribazole phosphatase